jgi:dipeptidyl aminopeptidase/acylaminoacyl peptidase
MRILRFGVLACALAASSLSAQEWQAAKALSPAPKIAAPVFAQLGRMSGPDISPDGTHLAYLSSRSGRKHVVIHNLATGKKLLLPPSPGKYEFRWVGWANNDRILVGLGFEGRRGIDFSRDKFRETRLLSMGRDGSNIINMIKPKKSAAVGSLVPTDSTFTTAINQDDVIYWSPEDPDTVLVSIYDDYTKETGANVRKINVNTGDYTIVAGGQRNVDNYYTDLQGVVRLAFGSVKSGNKFNRFLSFRDPADNQWKRSDTSPLLKDETIIASFTNDPNFAYAYAQVEGRRSLVKFDMRTQAIAETLYRDADLDVDSIYRDEKSDVIGVELAGGKDVFFNPTWNARRKGLSAALKDYEINITTITDDGKFVLLRATNATEPGLRYLYDVTKKSITELEFDYAGLGSTNAPYRTTIKYTARDGLPIEAILTLPRGVDPKNLPTIMLPHGGPWAQDDVNYNYEAAFLANRGYAVLQPNFRGSTGYGKAFLDKGNGQWGLTMQDDITDGVAWLVKNGISDKSRMCILGGSYGGYAALMGAVKTPDLFKCAISINGVSDILKLLKDDNGAFKDEVSARLIGDLDKDRERLKATSPYYNAEKITAPILLIHAKDDQRVDYRQSIRMRDRLQEVGKSVEYVEIADGEHFLENEAARVTYLTAVESFLAKHLGK